ncbi:MAG TPA: ComF family protein, partial [Gammaproteobacteria bacterium]|nr:ComF family protein [Gammaproteobacteria bacterium]
NAGDDGLAAGHLEFPIVGPIMIPDAPRAPEPRMRRARITAALRAARKTGAGILAARCLCCNARGAGALCPSCFRDLPWNDHPCENCATPLPDLPGTRCGACARRAPLYDAATAAFVYAWPVNRLLQDFKFRGRLPVGRILALALAEYLDLHQLPRPDVLVPVPLHRGRLAGRGFNQAAEIARILAQSLDVAAEPALLSRARPTPPQLGLPRRERRRNLRGAFACRRALAGVHVAIVDDVITTGSTAEAAAQVLKRAGATRVDVYALARA